MINRLLSIPVKGRNIFVLFIATTVIYTLMLTITIPKLMTFSGGKKIIDMMPGGYNTSFVVDLLGALGEEGRSFYLTRQLPLDFIYPVAFAVTYALIFVFFLRKINRHDSPWKFIALLPVIAGVADYLENIGIIAMLKTYPDISTSLVQLSSSVSVLKASATTVYFVSLIILLVAVGVMKLRQRRLA